MFYTFVIPEISSLVPIKTPSDLRLILISQRCVWMPHTFRSKCSAQNAAKNYLKYYIDNENIDPIIVFYTTTNEVRNFEVKWASTLGRSIRWHFHLLPLLLLVSHPLSAMP